MNPHHTLRWYCCLHCILSDTHDKWDYEKVCSNHWAMGMAQLLGCGWTFSERVILVSHHTHNKLEFCIVLHSLRHKFVTCKVISILKKLDTASYLQRGFTLYCSLQTKESKEDCCIFIQEFDSLSFWCFQMFMLEL